MKNTENKYWFIEYDIHCDLWNKTPKRNQCVSSKHPFEWLKSLSQMSSFQRVLIDWKEITKEEYKLGIEIYKIG